MQEVKIKPRTIIRFHIEDKTYDVRKPKLGELGDLEDNLANSKGSKATLKVMGDFLFGLGLPKEVTNDLEGDQLLEIIEAVKGAGKKN